MKFYGLYKQAIKGVCSAPKPGLTDFVDRAKWIAWSALGKMTQEDAQKQYIQTVQQFISSSTTTTTRESLFPHIENVYFLEYLMVFMHRQI